MPSSETAQVDITALANIANALVVLVNKNQKLETENAAYRQLLEKHQGPAAPAVEKEN